jgi:hypothetical protein
MPAKQLKIIKKPNGGIEPETGKKSNFKKGESVMFTAQPGASGVSITFLDRSPFGSDNLVVNYGQELEIKADFDQSPTARNSYPYKCVLKIDGVEQVGLPDAGAGGEIIIVQG